MNNNYGINTPTVEQKKNSDWKSRSIYHKTGVEVDPTAGPEQWMEACGANFNVARQQMFYSSVMGDNMFPNVPASDAALVRTDTVPPQQLSTVPAGGNWMPFQNQDFFSVCHNLTLTGLFEMELAGVANGGQQVWGLLKLKGDHEEWYAGDDPHTCSIHLLSQHKYGSSAIMGKPVVHRLVCANGMTLTDSLTKLFSKGHNQSLTAETATAAFVESAKAVGLAIEMIDRMQDTVPTNDDLESFLTTLFPDGAKGKTRTRIRWEEIYNDDSLPGQAEAQGVNKIFQTTTYYVDHVAGRVGDKLKPGQEERALTSAMFGSSSRRKNQAFDYCSKMVNDIEERTLQFVTA